ncbi:histidinol-phosphatase [Helicobacter turcicus]|uniref:Histidinol-phosphatase n=1 Tax=Helicobacter turcicus TaxID=2867412 RepID=A0ABS7JP85_9HELI|nr:histidinol-phosphatase [Helicobacter turcicus]MBX7491187.1 histidinol-phosphatase [Helicobacter turcicus]MBX7546054.1 histidinol-phosphatase [Helicobacter turcicus]
MHVDLHNHTSLCNHATGTMEEYIIKAIEKGIDVFGFSCHNPMAFDSKYRMRFEELPLYLDSLKTLREKYVGQIEILSALEIDFLPQFMEDSLFKIPLDYRIGAVHFLGDWGFDNLEFIREYAKRDINDCWVEYFKAIEMLANSGKFDIVAHIDLLKIFKYFPTKDLRREIETTLKAIKRANMSVEINAAGFRKEVGEQYPSREILEMCYGFEIPITFGSDAHAINQINFKRKEIEALAKDVGYTKCAVYRQREQELVEF